MWLYKKEADDCFNVTATSGLIVSAVEYWGNSWVDYDNEGYLDTFIIVMDNSQIDQFVKVRGG